MGPSGVHCKVTKNIWHWQTISCRLTEYPYIDLSEPITFETEAEIAAFGAGLGYGKDERGEVEQLILNTNNPDDVEIIRLIEETE